MALEHKSRGEDLDEAIAQLLDYLPSLSAAEHPWLLIACDFATVKWQNLETADEGEFPLAALPDNLDLFYWIAGYDRPHERFESEEEANLLATSLLAAVHDRLKQQGYPDQDLREWLTRILFILFADDTGVWDRALFHSYIALHTKPDGSDLGSTIALIFQVLDTPREQRQTNLDDELQQLTFVNGDLFANRLSIPVCDKDTRDALLLASTFNWSLISPAIFGSLFQNVMEPAERRQLGAHYTTEENILRTIRPLFLDELERDFASASSKPKLRRYLDRLADLNFFDPACGCGNFLVVAYREVRRLELEALRRLRELERTSGQQLIDVTLQLKVRVDQFHGIEIEEFPARIARTALYLADHLANREVSAEFGQHYVRFPIPAAPHIVIGNALRMDWKAVLSPDDCNYVFGNPPYAGKHLLTDDQRSDLQAAFRGVQQTGALDHVAAWFYIATDYVRANPGILGAFVATNSVTQGEQVPVLWPLLHRKGLHITFAWRTFEWRSEASGRAHVHVVIIGFAHLEQPPIGFLYEEVEDGPPRATRVQSLNGYLIDAPEAYPSARGSPLAGVPPVVYGSKPVDDGHLILSADEADEIRRKDPIAAAYIRPLYSAAEFLRGQDRYCLWLVDAEPHDVRRSPGLQRRLEGVRSYRTQSKKKQTQALAQTPGVFGEIRNPTGDFVFVPIHVSGNRRLIPMGFVSANERAIVHNSGAFIEDAGLALFGVLQSAMFTSWQATVGGRIKSDYRFNNKLVYNTFPFVELSNGQRARIEAAVLEVLDVRSAHPDASLADLYDVLATPADLVAAHRDLDRAVDAAFSPRRKFTTDADRLVHLMERYLTLDRFGQLDVSGTRFQSRRRRRTSGAVNPHV
jgi:hypothetical protein